MATQTIEFSATTGLTLTAKMFAVGSDTVAGSVSATEKTNHKSRYTATFTDLAAGDYLLSAFVSSTGGFANEKYTILAATNTYYPFSEINSPTLTVIPATATSIDRVNGTSISCFAGELATVSVSVTDQDGNAVDLSGMTLELVVEAATTTDVVVIADADITVNGSTFSFDLTAGITASERLWQWALRNTSDESVQAHGTIEVNYAPTAD